MGKYKGKKGTPANVIPQGKLQRYANRVNGLMGKNGGKITPLQIVKDAENHRSPLHEYFEWDNSKAAHEWRLQQARVLLGAVVQVVVVSGKRKEHRSFFNVHDVVTKEKVYVTLETAIKTKSYRDELIDKIIRHLGESQSLLGLFKSQK